MSESILQIRDLRVSFPTDDGDVQAVRGIDLDVAPGELVAIVGESGSGKSVSMLAVMGLLPKGTKISGSATIGGEELIGAAPRKLRSVRGKRIASNIKLALVVPGSGLVKEQAEREGLDRIFTAAGFEWREPGCSMCLGMNADHLEPGERSASTSNRNFEGRQGAGGRTHLVSPEMAAAAAVAGHFVDVRRLV